MTELTYLFKQDIIDMLDAKTLNELTGGRQIIGDNPAVAGDDQLWIDNLPKSIEKIKGYSRHWYDMDTEMRNYFQYDAADAFTLGQRVASVEDGNGLRTLYVCIQDAPAATALTDADFFNPIDERNQVLLESTIMFLVYTLSRRLNPRQIPEQRQIDYDNSTDTMKDVQKGRIMLEIAEREEVEGDDAGHEISYGNFDDSNPDIY